MSRHCNARTWQRYKRQLKAIPLEDVGGFAALREIDRALEEFHPIRLADLQIAA
jgi:hypothetical protein